MCRVIGITNFGYNHHREIVDRFCGLARTGMVMAEDPPGHEDGWGLAFYRQGQLVVHKSGASLLDETKQLHEMLSTVQTSPVMILHLRKSAWSNTSNTRHAHPFHAGNSVFFHNGVVYEYQGLLPAITCPGLTADARDTEVFFYHILSQAAGNLGQQFLASAAVIRQKHRYSALNCLFSDGARFYACRDFAKESEYYSLFKAYADGACLVSSEPLDENLTWELMGQGEFLEVALESGV